MSKNDTWYQIEIEDPEALPGKNLIVLLNLLNNYISIKFITVNDIIGAVPSELWELSSAKTFAIKNFIKITQQVKQFDWGYFYLCSEKKNAKEICKFIKKENYKYDLINEPDTKTTIRAFDDMSFIIYTANSKIPKLILSNYPEAKIKKGSIENMEFYY